MVLVSGNRITETDHPPQLKLVNKFGNLNSIACLYPSYVSNLISYKCM